MSGRERANGTYHRDTGRHCESQRERKKLCEDKCKRAPSRSEKRPVRFSGPLRVACAVAGFVAGTWLLMQTIPAVIYVMLVIANGIRVALGWGSVL